jgi:hypothetical protein
MDLNEIAKIERFAHLVAQAEREACALICDEHWRHSGTAQECADAIRAMGPASEADQSPRYPMVYCSQCGGGFGPGDEGFSDCRYHCSYLRLV